MEKDSEIVNTQKYILSTEEDVFSCVQEKNVAVCREAENLFSGKYKSLRSLRRIINLVSDYETALEEGNYDLAKMIFYDLYSARDEFALSEGCGSYRAFVLEREYGITEDDVRNLLERVKNADIAFAPCHMSGKWADSAEESFVKIISVFEKIPGIGEFVKLLKENGRIDIFSLRDYTLSREGDELPAVNVRLTGEKDDIFRFAHELGHAYGIYLSGAFPDVISGEIHALLTEFFICGNYFPEEMNALSIQKKNSLLKACAVTEYELSSLGIEMSGELWDSIHRKYGLLPEKRGYITYSHLYGFPLYNISYIIAILYILESNKSLSVDKYEILMRKVFSYSALREKSLTKDTGEKHETKAYL